MLIATLILASLPVGHRERHHRRGDGSSRAVRPVERATARNGQRDFDGDGRADVAATVTAPTGTGDDVIALFVALATGVAGRAGMMQLCETARVLVADIDGNGRDDIDVVNLDCNPPFLRVLTH